MGILNAITGTRLNLRPAHRGGDFLQLKRVFPRTNVVFLPTGTVSRLVVAAEAVENQLEVLSMV